MEAMKKGAKFFKQTWMIWCLLAVFVFFLLSGLLKHLSVETLIRHGLELRAYVKDHWFLAAIGYVVCYALYGGFFMPGTFLLSITAGVFFPQPWAVILASCGASLASVVTYLLLHTGLREWIHRFAGKWIIKIEKEFQQGSISYLLFLRLSHIVPYWVTNVAGVIFGVNLFRIVWTTFVGSLPASYVFSEAGLKFDNIIDNDEELSIQLFLTNDVGLLGLFLGISVLLPVIYRKIKGRKAPK